MHAVAGEPALILVEGPHPATLDEELLLRACELGKDRSSGPGGQHRNKVETKVVITHRPTGIVGQASERRSAVENKKVAVRRLRLALATEARSPVPVGDARTELWRSRTGGGKISCNPRHADFPALLAEAMDMLEACGWDPKKAGIRLEVTPSQLIKLVKEHPAAWERVNRAREARGAHKLS